MEEEVKSAAINLSVDVMKLIEIIKPDINGIYESLKKKQKKFFIMIFVSIPFSFMIGPVIFLTLHDSIIYKIKDIKLILTLKNEIEVRDKTYLKNLSLSNCVGKNSVILIINKLIETGNLKGYEVVGDVGVVKIELNAKVSDFPLSAANAVAVASTAPDVLKIAIENVQGAKRIYKCPNCGAAITGQTGKFCTFCGTRLE